MKSYSIEFCRITSKNYCQLCIRQPLERLVSILALFIGKILILWMNINIFTGIQKVFMLQSMTTVFQRSIKF